MTENINTQIDELPATLIVRREFAQPRYDIDIAGRVLTYGSAVVASVDANGGVTVLDPSAQFSPDVLNKAILFAQNRRSHLARLLHALANLDALVDVDESVVQDATDEVTDALTGVSDDELRKLRDDAAAGSPAPGLQVVAEWLALTDLDERVESLRQMPLYARLVLISTGSVSSQVLLAAFPWRGGPVA